MNFYKIDLKFIFSCQVNFEFFISYIKYYLAV